MSRTMKQRLRAGALRVAWAGVLAGAVFVGGALAGCGFAEGESAALDAPCSVQYRVTGKWPGGFQVNVSFDWSLGHLEGWVLQIEYADPHFDVAGWAARWSRTGSTVVAVNEPWNGTVYYGESVDGLGFNATGTGVPPHVRAITVNGSRCTPR